MWKFGVMTSSFITASWLILILYWITATILTRENSLVRTAADTQKKIKIKQEKVDEAAANKGEDATTRLWSMGEGTGV